MPGRSTVESSSWRLPAIRQLARLTLLGFTGFAATLASLPWWAVHRGASPTAAGLVTTVMLGVTVVVQFLVPAVERRLGTGRTLAIGVFALGAPSPMYLVSKDLAPMLVVSAVRGVGFGVLTVLGASLTAVLAPPGRHGEAVGLYGLAIAAPNLLVVPGAVALAQNAPSGPSSCWRRVRCWPSRRPWPSAATAGLASRTRRRAVVTQLWPRCFPPSSC